MKIRLLTDKLRVWHSYILLSFVFIFNASSCSYNEPNDPRMATGNLSIFLNPVRLGIVLPGSYFPITGQGLLEEASYEVYLDLNETNQVRRIPLESVNVEEGILVRWPIEEGLNIQDGAALGSILVEATLRGFTGLARTEWSGTFQKTVQPSILQMSPLVSPQTLSVINGDGFLDGGEGLSIINLSGEFTDFQGVSQTIEISEPLLLSNELNLTNEQAQEELFEFRGDRLSRWWIPRPVYFGIQGGRFTGVATITNNGPGGLTMSEAQEVSFEVSEPFLSFVSPSSISRGQRLFIEGGGLVSIVEGNDVGLTTLSFTGRLIPYNELQGDLEYNNLNLEVKHYDGAKISTSFEPDFNSSCESLDLGGVSGVLEGTLQATIYWQDEEFVTSALPISLEIAPSKQIVYLSFLPAFTDSLRLFGLRNLSSRVVDEIIAVVRRDYAGINIDIRTTPPSDYDLYSIVEIGGPDPNAQSLFGLDNTTGLDVCNQRLDDNLAGRNAESGNSYGGVFVESFLNLSPSRSGDANGLADPLFDDVFQPLMNEPAQLNDLEGARTEQVLRAVRVLGHLVGNTLTHEIGHSLGLPVVAGCGAYHNAPGPRQIMDCGRDRPFIERAGLDPEGPPRWTDENLEYLQKILPLQ